MSTPEPKEWIERRRALLVAVSEYDDPEMEKLHAPPGDAERLRQVLINPARGRVLPEDLRVVHDPDLPGLLRELDDFIAESTPEEMLIFFFSGHAILEPGEVFLACRNTSPSRPWTNALPGHVLRGLLEGAAARAQIVILDCCHAGGLYAGDDRAGAAMVRALDSGGDGDVRRAVLAASGIHQEAYEQHRPPPCNDHSLFTDALIAGLDSGDADLDGDGVVSMADLFGHVADRTHQLSGGRQTPELTATAGAQDLTLSRVPVTGADLPATGRSLLAVQLPGQADEVRVRELDAPLQVLSDPIARLKDTLDRSLPLTGGGLLEWLLDGIVGMMGADTAFVCTGPRWDLHAHSRTTDGDRLVSEAARAIDRLRASIDGTAGSTAGWRATAADGTETIAVPLTPRGTSRWLFVVGDLMPTELLIEPVATVCRAVCESHDWAYDPNPLRAVCAAWDALRRRAGFVPQEIYRARRAAFLDQLRGVVPYFQPVLYLHRYKPRIESWEALARETGGSTSQAPAHLFESAELWGREFMLLLDQHMLGVAVGEYRDQTRSAPMHRTPGLPQAAGLTVNVYPDTLLANEYFEDLRELVLGRDGIEGQELALEISEKRPIPGPPPGVVWDGAPLQVFKDRLKEYTGRLGVRLAIDDFGVGHGSLERLSGLALSYVKLDQWFTEQRDEGLAIEFVRAAINAKTLGGDKVVLEGFRDRAPFQLEDAFQLEVRYLQGEFVGVAAPELKRELEPDRVARVHKAGEVLRRPGRITGQRGDALPPRVPGFGRAVSDQGG